MAETLLEILKKRLGEQPAPLATGVGTGDEASRLLRAKLTGKAETPGAAPRRALTGEQQALAGAQAQQAQQQVTGALQAEQLAAGQADIQQREQVSRQQDQAERRLKEQQFQQQLAQTIGDVERGRKQLTNQKDLADLEQAGFYIRLNNKNYLQKLQNEAAKDQLDNELRFKDAYYRQVFGDDEKLFRERLDWSKIMAQDERAFTDELAKINLDNALAIANQAARQEATRGMYQGVGGLISGGLKAIAARPTPAPDVAAPAAAAAADEEADEEEDF